VQAEEVELHLSMAAQVKAAQVTSHESALGAVQADEVRVTNGGIGAARAETIHVQGLAGAVAANTVQVENSYVGAVAGREVRGERIESLVLLAGRVEGEVHTVVDTRGAVIAGLVGGLFAGLILLVGRIAFRRK
jgi:hypothetical protein